MDLSIVVFDLRDAIEELREERAELLKRIEALEEKQEPESKQQQAEPENGVLDARKCVELFPKPRNSHKGHDHQNHEDIDEDHALDQFAEVVHSGILPEAGSR
jgi:hypothetical protein